MSDERLVTLIAEGAPEGMEFLYDRYGRLAYTLALRILRDTGTAEDVVQEALMSVWRRATSYSPARGSVMTWLCAIVHHRAIDRLRGRQERAGLDLPLDEATPLPDATTDVWHNVSTALQRDQVRRALDELPAEQRRTVELAYFEGHTQAEISLLMDVPLGTVKGRARLALRRLRATLIDQCDAGLETSDEALDARRQGGMA